MQCEASVLRDVILRVWTPAVGARSVAEFIDRNRNKIIALEPGHFSLIFMIGFNNSRASTLPVIVDKYFDNKPPFEVSEVILSGSWSEGLFVCDCTNMKYSDVDQMCVLKHISFSEDDQHAGNLTLREDTPFVFAYRTDEAAIKMWKGFLVEEGNLPGKRLSSKKLNEKLEGNYQTFMGNSKDDNSNYAETGAAMNINPIASLLSYMKDFGKIFESNELFSNIDFSFVNVCINGLKKECPGIGTGCDIVLSISCDGWPSCAKEWAMRKRIWPCDDLVRKITNDGFHIVPKSSTEGDFRLSFSCAEITLIESLTELQQKVLRSFKAVVKYHQSAWSPNIKEIITTYHLKTIAFWHFEKIAQDSFTEETLVRDLVLLIQKLAESLRKQELPMYFMPKVNLFKSVEDSEEVFDIAEKIEQLCQDFPQIIKAVASIIIFSDENERDCGEFLNCSHEKASPSFGQMPTISAVSDKLVNILIEKFLNVMIANNLRPQKTTETENIGARMTNGFESCMQDVYTSDMENSIELD